MEMGAEECEDRPGGCWYRNRLTIRIIDICNYEDALIRMVLNMQPDRETRERRNEARRLISLSNRNHSNCIRIGENETYNHARAKFEVCKKLLDGGNEFYTECIFEGNQGRADIFCLDTKVVVEILSTETLEQCKEKVEKYPSGLRFEVAYMENDKLIWKVK